MEKEFSTASGSHQSAPSPFQLNTIEEAIKDISEGKIVIVVDDEDRENEGDFICAAECITPEIITFMATHGRGLICTPLEERLADKLNLPMMVNDNTSLHSTAFTVSIDFLGKGCTTGISSYDRATGIKALVDPKTDASDFARPGHIFPLRAKTGGVLRRTGHTEAATDLAKLAGYAPVGVLVEILNEDGTMSRLPQLIEIANKHMLKVISIKDLVAYRMKHERIIVKEYETQLKSKFGEFDVKVFRQETSDDLHLALVKGDLNSKNPVMVRVHSSTETDDIIGNLFEDYGDRIKKSLSMIENEGNGVFLFMRHSDPERPRDLINELKRRTEKDKSPDINTSSGIQRDFGVGAQILRELGVEKIRLITSSSRHRVGLIGYGLEIVEHVPIY